jgi:chemotaxis-related protein WspB
MLFILFQLGGDRYALDAAQVAEVLPLVQVKKIPRAPAGVAGVFTYHGAPVPVLDLCELALGRPALARLSTRLLLVHYADASGARRLLGLVAEQATETLRREPKDFVASGVRSDGAPYLGPVVHDARGLIQWIEVDKLLPPAVRDSLFQQAEEAAAS